MSIAAFAVKASSNVVEFLRLKLIRNLIRFSNK
jgi:hypothetical protein